MERCVFVCLSLCVCVFVYTLTSCLSQSWAAGDIVSCLLDLDEGTITFCL